LTRGNGFKLKEGRFRLDIRKKLFMMRIGKYWHRLPREVVAPRFLEMFNARLEGAPSPALSAFLHRRDVSSL